MEIMMIQVKTLYSNHNLNQFIPKDVNKLVDFRKSCQFYKERES
jgi:hypothetical protein